jgi:hypothetical protein
MLIQGGYRWIIVMKESAFGRKADLTSGTAHSVEAEKAVRIGRKTAADGFPAADFDVRRGAQISKTLGVQPRKAQDIVVCRAIQMARIPLTAYRVIPITVLKNLYMGRKAVGENAETHPTESKWTMGMARKAVGENADTHTTAAKWMMLTRRTAVLDSGTGHETETERDMRMGRVATLDSGDAHEFGMNRSMRLGSRISAATWGDPVLLEDGTLLIKQAYHAEVINGVLEVS